MKRRIPTGWISLALIGLAGALISILFVDFPMAWRGVFAGLFVFGVAGSIVSVVSPAGWSRYWELVKSGFSCKGACQHCGIPTEQGERFCSDEHEDAYASSTAW